MGQIANQMLLEAIFKLKEKIKEKKTNNSKVLVHQVKIDFNVTEQIKRFVYVYIIEAENCYMVDSGVHRCETQILDYLKTIGRDISDIKGIFLTHAHPDHIGSAAWFQKNTNCKIYASVGEKSWIEDIDLQFRERPIPNFYKLAGESVNVDVVVKDGDIISLEAGLDITVIRTAGHSADGISYLVDDVLFIGDAVPVQGDIPIWVDEKEIRKTLDRIGMIPGVKTYYPAWDHMYSKKEMDEKLKSAEELLDMLKAAVLELDKENELSDLVDSVCEHLGMPMLKTNPLFARTIASLRKE